MKTIYSVFFILLFSTPLLATHNQAGEIIIHQIDDFTIEASIITYTKESSVPADRDSLYINWGDGTVQRIARVNGPDQNGEPIGNDTKKNIYTETHTYSAMLTYLISMTDPNRSGGILNVNPPISDNIAFHIETEFTLKDMESGSLNTSPILLEAPIDIAFQNVPFVHVPNGFDPDGDSLSYELITPLEQVGDMVPNYFVPSEISPGPDNTISIDPVTGVLSWTAPQMQGSYVVAILIKSYRNDEQIGYMIRDMMITVKEGPEFAPDIVFSGAPENIVTPVFLGDTIRVEFEITEPDTDQELYISSTCALYENNFYNSNATFESFTSGNNGTATFEWIVREEHLRQYPYMLVLKSTGSQLSDAAAAFAVFRFQTADFVSSTQNIITDKVAVQLYPNPVSQILTLETEIDASSLYRLISADGRIVKSGQLKVNREVINVEDLPIGWYSVQLFQKNEFVAQRPILIVR